MSKNTRWSADDFKKQGLIETPKGFVKASSQVAKGPVTKIEPGVRFGVNQQPIGNKKIRNATKSVMDGVKFDSQLERTMYETLTASKISFEFQYIFTLQPKFKYRDENIRATTKVVDFYLPHRGVIIDTKGYSNDISPLKHKMLKNALKYNYGIEPEILMPKNKKECDLLLNRLLYGKP